MAFKYIYDKSIIYVTKKKKKMDKSKLHFGIYLCFF